MSLLPVTSQVSTTTAAGIRLAPCVPSLFSTNRKRQTCVTGTLPAWVLCGHLNGPGLAGHWLYLKTTLEHQATRKIQYSM